MTAPIIRRWGKIFKLSLLLLLINDYFKGAATVSAEQGGCTEGGGMSRENEPTRENSSFKARVGDLRLVSSPIQEKLKINRSDRQMRPRN